MSLEQLLYAAENGAESISEGGISRRGFLKWGSPLSCSDYKILGSGLGDDVLEGAC